MRTMDKVRAAASAIAERVRLAATAGLTFGGDRDLYATLGYDRQILPVQYRHRYERNGIATTIVEAFPNATWRGYPEIIEDEDPEVTTEFEERWKEFQERLQVWSVLRSADILSGLGHYAVVLIGAPGRFEDPLPDRLSLDSIRYLQPYGEEDAKVLLYDENSDSERYGQPVEYSLVRTSSNVKLGGKTPRVHWTRMLHVADGALSDKVYGQPRLRKVWNWLDDLEKVTGGGSEAFWRRVHQGMHLDLDSEEPLGTDELKKLEDEADAMIHQMRRMLATRNTKIQMLGSDVSPFNNQVTSLLSLISGATGIPQRILLGSERGELASTQDRENWNDKVSDRQTEYVAPRMIRPLVDLLTSRRALPEPESYEVRWPKKGALSETQKVDVAEKASKLPPNVITPAEIRDHYLGLEPLEEDELDPLAEQDEDGDDMTEDENDELLQESGVRSAAASLHAVADRHRSSVNNVVTRAVERARRAMDVTTLAQAVEDDRVDEVVSPVLAVMVSELMDGLSSALLTVVDAAGTSAARSSFRSSSGLRVAKVTVSFDRSSSQATAFAKRHAAELVTDISADTRRSISKVVTRGVQEGRTPDSIARELRSVIGLSSRDEDAVANLRRELRAKPGALIRRSGIKVRVPARGFSDKRINELSKKYADSLLRKRADTIARTETIRASNEGQRLLWRQARSEGLIGDNARRKWIVTKDDRLDKTVCRPMSGQKVGIDDFFVLPDGSQVMSPPAHARCRCAQVLTFARARRRAASECRVPAGGPGGGQFSECGGSAGGSAASAAFSSAPDGNSKAWVKEHQDLYDNDPEFRAAADAATLFTQGDYAQISRSGTGSPTGLDPGKEMSGAPGADYRNFFKGQKVEDGTKVTWKEGADALGKVVDENRVSETIYRGLMGQDAYMTFQDLKEGQTLDIAGLTSFTTDSSIADKFSKGRGPGQYRLQSGSPRTIIEIQGGAPGVKVGALSPYKQKEVITRGKFTVVHNIEHNNEYARTVVLKFDGAV